MNDLFKNFKIQPTKLRGENMKEENIITEFIQTPIGFTLSECDLTTGIVTVNNIEITSVEDWNKVTKSLLELQQENQQLKYNWNKLKEWLNTFHKLSEFEQWEIVNKMKELEKGDSNE